jgi:hypothetical protein
MLVFLNKLVNVSPCQIQSDNFISLETACADKFIIVWLWLWLWLMTGVQGLLWRIRGGKYTRQFCGCVRTVGRDHGFRVSPDLRVQDSQRVSVGLPFH